MGAFQTGFGLGQRAYDSARYYKDREEELALRKAQDARAAEEAGIRMEGMRRTNRVNAQSDTDNEELRNYIHNGGGDGGVLGAGYPGGGVMSAPGVMPGDQPDIGGLGMGDLSTPNGQMGLNRKLMEMYARKGDYTALGGLNDKNRELQEQQIFNAGVQQFSMNPDSFDEYAKWVNRNNPMISTAPAKDPRTGQLTGYNIMTVGPSGDAVHKFIAPQQAAQLAGAVALMRTNPTKALAIMGQVDQGLAAAVAASNTATQTAVNSGNNAVHMGMTDATNERTAAAHEKTANAAMARANREKQTEGEKLQEKVDAYAGILVQQNPQLSPADAKKKAADIILRDPNLKDKPDVGLGENGLFRVHGSDKLYTMGPNGQPQEVQLPGEDATTKALKQLAAGGKDPFAAKPQKPLKPGGSTGREASGKVTDVAPASTTPPKKDDKPIKPVSFNGMSGAGLRSNLYQMVARAESGGKRYNEKGGLTTSSKGAKGEMQVMDATFKDPGYGVKPARNNSPEERARVGRDYLDALVEEFDDVPKALAAYNAGPGAVKKAVRKYGADWLDNLPDETQNYVEKISRMRPSRTA